MTRSRLCFPPERDSPPPQAVSQETCWYGREVKGQLNVLVSLDKFNGTGVLCGAKYKEPLVTSTSSGRGQDYIRLCVFSPRSPRLNFWSVKVVCLQVFVKWVFK